jgi:hypothetical protein
MYDVLFELSNLSVSLQKNVVGLIEADKIIKRTIRINSSFKLNHGTKFLEAKVA